MDDPAEPLPQSPRSPEPGSPPSFRVVLGRILRQVVVAIFLAMAATALFQIMDELILFDTIDFNDDEGGVLTLFTVFLVLILIASSPLTNPAAIMTTKLYMTSIGHPIADEVSKHFRLRAGKLRLLSWLVIGLILVVTIIGIAVFQTASLTTEENRARANQNELFARLTETREKRREIDLQIADLPEGPSEQRTQLEERLQALVATEREQSRDFEEQKRVVEGIDQSNTEYLVQVLGTKVGSVLLLLFLVRVLINLYRYNMRLASFYDSRADVLQLVGASPEFTSEHLIRAMGTEQFDFGATAGAEPSNAVVDLVDKLVKLRTT